MLQTTLQQGHLAPQTRRIKILLVEDNLPDIRFVEEMLLATSYELVSATSLNSVSQQAQRDSFQIVLLDLSLPDSSGLATFLSVAALMSNVPIVILTGLKDESVAAEAIQLGAQDFVQKSDITEEGLKRIIRYSIERNKSDAMQRDAAAKAIAAASYLELALRASHTGVWSWEMATNKVHFDDQMLTMFGLKDGGNVASIGEFLTYVHSDDRKRIALALKTAVKLKEEYDVDYRILWADGTEHHIAATAQIICDNSGVAVNMAGVCRDITKHKLAEKDAKRLVILEKHEDFIATLTHDLKNPLIGADRLLEMFLNGQCGALQEEQLKLLRVLQESNADMLALIKNLLGVYRYDEGTTMLTYVSLDVSLLAATCLNQLDAIAERAGISVVSNFPKGSHTIIADSIALSRVVRNLLSNAMKFTRSGGSIIVSGSIAGSSYILKVEDTGSGMPVKDVESLFQRYSQGSEGRRDPSGSGLGLYLCRQLVEAHGGTISCASQLGQGTTFTVTIPV